ncbi:hypothetical protein V1478_008021 [Vespula squamosa]|uniref:Uncharacterized protein n=1 Tax=Vespula squamosa TaxID=30214 RepID=A0ABD2AXL9_VESSQ
MLLESSRVFNDFSLVTCATPETWCGRNMNYKRNRGTLTSPVSRSHHAEVVASRDSRDNGDSILKSKFPDNMPVREKFGPQR